MSRPAGDFPRGVSQRRSKRGGPSGWLLKWHDVSLNLSCQWGHSTSSSSDLFESLGSNNFLVGFRNSEFAPFDNLRVGLDMCMQWMFELVLRSSGIMAMRSVRYCSSTNLTSVCTLSMIERLLPTKGSSCRQPSTKAFDDLCAWPYKRRFVLALRSRRLRELEVNNV